MTRIATVTTVRETTEAERDSEALRDCAWVAIDSRGYRFGGASEVEARELADEYHHPRHAKRERGRVSHPDKGAA